MPTCDHSQTKFLIDKPKHGPTQISIVCRRCGERAKDALGNPITSSSEDEAKRVWAEYLASKTA